MLGGKEMLGAGMWPIPNRGGMGGAWLTLTRPPCKYVNDIYCQTERERERENYQVSMWSIKTT